MKNQTMTQTQKLVTGALMVALGLLLPFLTGQVTFGTKLLPMHFPILIGGMLLGGGWGALIGAITPLLRSLLFGMPVMMPMAVGMAFELAAYGFLAGVLYQKMKQNIYVALVLAMIGGRVIWGLVSICLYGVMGNAFGMQMFLAGAFINAFPGILLQLLLVPVIVTAIQRGME